MPNDTAITRLLYAILSQKCLKDIDWNKVAHHPILSQEITNGHAARMRYSRFKKQMDGTATVRRPRGPHTPRKKVEKNSNKSPRKGKGKAKEEEEEDGKSGVKTEPGMGAGSRQGTVESDVPSSHERLEKRVKLEPGLGVASSSTSEPTPRTLPGTPSSSSRYIREASASPSPGPSDHERFEGGDIREMDEMGFSFGMPGEEAGMPGMYAPLMAGEFGMGMGLGMQMGLGDPFEGLWHGHGGHHGQGNAHVAHGSGMQAGEGGVMVKTEPRWEEAYRHV